MSAKKVIRTSSNGLVRLIKEEGSTSWVGRGQQDYFPVTYTVQGPPYSYVPNRNGVVTRGFAMPDEGPVMLEHKGRMTKQQRHEIEDWMEVLGANWAAWEAEAKAEQEAEQAAEQAAQTDRELTYLRKLDLVKLERAVIDAAVLRFQLENDRVDYEVTDADRTNAEENESAAVEALLNAKETP